MMNNKIKEMVLAKLLNACIFIILKMTQYFA